MPHHHRIVPISLLVVTVPIALFGAFLLVANILTHDEPPPDDSSLALPNVTVADADNAYIEMQRIEQSHSYPPEIDAKLADAVDGATWDDAYVASVLAKHAADVVLFRQAAAKPAFQDPMYARPRTLTELVAYAGLTSYRQAALTAALEAEHRARTGDVSGGLREAIDVVRFGHLMESGQGNVIEYLVGSAIKQIGLTALRQIASQSTVTAAQAQSVAKQLEPYRDSLAGAVKSLKVEYIGFNAFRVKYDRLGKLLTSYNITAVIENGKTIIRQPDTLGWDMLDFSGLTRFYYRSNQTWRFAVDRARANVRYAEADCAVADPNPPRITPIVEPSVTLLFTPNAIGKLLASIGEVSFGGFTTKRCNESVAVSATQTVLASRAFTADHGRVPATLSELVPKYLDAVPTDAYSGKPLLYSAVKKYVYSVGPDHKDLGGDPVSADWQHQKNPSFAIGI